VLVDEQPVPSCLVPVETVDGAAVQTLEGVAPTGDLDEVQQAFLDDFATQCGFCTSGMIMTAEALLAANPDPTRAEVVEAISGNVCRCTGYEPIVSAILDAAQRRRGSTAGEEATF
jgi:carbon-monoxide dehydrogenase small subunit